MSKSSRGKGDVSVDGRHICTLSQEDYVEVPSTLLRRVDSKIALSDAMHQSTRARDRLDTGYQFNPQMESDFYAWAIGKREFDQCKNIMTTERLYLLDYGAGNVRSLLNAIRKLGYSIQTINSVEDFQRADKIIFPGVGAFGAAMDRLKALGYMDALSSYIKSNKPFMGICVGMQVLFQGSEESPGCPGLGLIPAKVSKFNDSDKAVPHMGWNTAQCVREIDESARLDSQDRYYFVHSYGVMIPHTHFLQDYVYSITTYGSQSFVSSVKRGNLFATQFHPEKSGQAGLALLESFLKKSHSSDIYSSLGSESFKLPKDCLSKRIIACLDVRTNDAGDLVVTKGDQYDVREKEDGKVRNLGKPVELAKRYYEEGADEITFLNITSFRDCPLKDTPMLKILEQTSESVFVPLTIGGGIRDMIEPDGTHIPALKVASEYFRSGADKVSIGSDAVYASETFLKHGRKKDGSTAIEQISKVYGSQAVVVSVDPRRIYVNDPLDEPNHHVISTKVPGPKGERYCWYQCTVKGGREGRDLDVYQLVTACEALGAGEILVNCMDKDGTNAGYDLELLKDVKSAVKIPVIASSGAGKVEHFTQVFEDTNVEAALAAGIFHRQEVPISAVKKHVSQSYPIRLREH